MTGILLVDSDPLARATFAQALNPLGAVEPASNGADALRLLATKKFGVVLLELHLPLIDGFAILRTLASKPGPNKNTPIFVITSSTSEQMRVRALREHATFVLTKPVQIATLATLVDAELKKAAAREALAREGGTTPVQRPSPSAAPPPREGGTTPVQRPSLSVAPPPTEAPHAPKPASLGVPKSGPPAKPEA